MTDDLMMTSLNAVEQSELAQYEQTIRKGLNTFFDVGIALGQIRAKRLYRDHHDTFEEYCQERWEMSKTHANRYIASAETMKVLTEPPAQMTIDELTSDTTTPIGVSPPDNTPIDLLPENESQVRPLTKLEPDQQRTAWAQVAQAVNAGAKLTAALVEDVVKQLLTPKPTPEDQQPTSEPAPIPDERQIDIEQTISQQAIRQQDAEPDDDEQQDDRPKKTLEMNQHYRTDYGTGIFKGYLDDGRMLVELNNAQVGGWTMKELDPSAIHERVSRGLTCEVCGKLLPTGKRMLELMDQDTRKFLCDECKATFTPDQIAIETNAGEVDWEKEVGWEIEDTPIESKPDVANPDGNTPNGDPPEAIKPEAAAILDALERDREWVNQVVKQFADSKYWPYDTTDHKLFREVTIRKPTGARNRFGNEARKRYRMDGVAVIRVNAHRYAPIIAGIEVKVEKHDLLNDTKIGEYFDYCDTFYLAVPESLDTEARKFLLTHIEASQNGRETPESRTLAKMGLLIVHADGSVSIAHRGKELFTDDVLKGELCEELLMKDLWKEAEQKHMQPILLKTKHEQAQGNEQTEIGRANDAHAGDAQTMMEEAPPKGFDEYLLNQMLFTTLQDDALRQIIKLAKRVLTNRNRPDQEGDPNVRTHHRPHAPTPKILNAATSPDVVPRPDADPDAEPERPTSQYLCATCEFHRGKNNRSHKGKLIGHYYHGKCIRPDGLCEPVAALINQKDGNMQEGSE